ncbi:MAG TPA: glycosyltransferase family 9 protein [Phycisphaerae bacterium]|nr:glycosyltransferase family 9 protein [Phycisphaerae bacterium]
MKATQRIAVFLPNWVGDVVMATPALRALRKVFPAGDSQITFVGKAVSLATVSGCHWADGTLEDRSSSPDRLSGFFQTAGELRRRRIDLAILLPNSLRSALLAKTGGCRHIAGYNRDGRGLLLTDRLTPNRNSNGKFAAGSMIDYYNKLPEYFGALPEEIGCVMSLPVGQSEEIKAQQLFCEAGVDLAKPVVILNPGCAFGPSKMWGAQRYAQLADELIEQRSCNIIINAAPNERRIASRVAGAMRYTPLLNFAERKNTLPLLRSLMKRCDLLVTNDTGARHIGAAFGVALVTIFASTDQQWTDLYYDR